MTCIKIWNQHNLLPVQHSLTYLPHLTSGKRINRSRRTTSTVLETSLKCAKSINKLGPLMHSLYSGVRPDI